MYIAIISFLYLSTVPSVNSSIPVTIQPVHSGDVVYIKVFLNVSNKPDCNYVLSLTSVMYDVYGIINNIDILQL